jgi:phage tail-like protein
MADPRAIFSISGPDLPTDKVEVGKGTFTIGRVAENNLPLNNQKVSRRHADINWETDHFTIEDLESSNGTILNEERLEPRKPAALKVGDVIRIGPFSMTLISVDEGKDAPSIPVQVLAPEPPAPEIHAPPPEGAPSADESAPEPYISQPPVEPHAARTNKAEQTVPPPPENPNPQAKPKEVKVKEVKPKAADLALAVPPERRPATNGHRRDIVPYTPIEGVPLDQSRYLQFLPGVFSDSDFLKRYLLIQESILAPLEWGIDSFEQFYNPDVTTPDWLQWIASWFDVYLHPAMPLERQKAVVSELGQVYRARGTRRCLIRVLQAYFDVEPQIVEHDDPPSSFTVKLPLSKKENTQLNRVLAERLIDTLKPGYTSFKLEIG